MEWFSAVFVAVDKTHQQRSLAHMLVKVLHDLERFGNKTRFVDEVLRWIAGDRELGREN